MVDRVLRWGILGTARINRALIPPLRKSKRSRLQAVASRDSNRAAEYAREWKIPRSFGAYEALLADPEIDAIYISLPNTLHTEWTIRAAEAGKHVLCEKPLAVSLEEVDAIIDAGQRTGVVIAEAFMYRHHPQTLKVKELVDRGVLGKLQLVRGSFTYKLRRVNDVRLKPELGGGSIWDVGCYPISYARTLVGSEPVEVYAWQVTGPSGVDLMTVGSMRFPGDTFAQFDSSFDTQSRSQVEVVGSEASLLVQAPYKPGEREKLILKQDERIEEIPVKGNMTYLGEVEDLESAVLDGTPPRISLADSRANVAAILALIESARLGQPVSLTHVNLQ